MRVLKGKPLPGHMGNEQVTIQNLVVMEVNTNDNYILVSGNIPGPKKSFVLVKSSIKNNKSESKPELVSYEVIEEVIVEEPVKEEETVSEPEVTESEVTEESEVVEEKESEEVKEEALLEESKEE